MRNLTYFIADLHLGATYIKNPIDYERHVVKWLHSIKDTAKTLYLLGDILDYWYEYRHVVPRGYTRFLGTLAELADSGVEIYWFVGNHDIWISDYLPKEIGLKEVVDGNIITEIGGKKFFLAHGDGVGKLKPAFKFIRRMFRNKLCQRLYSAIHPRWTVPFAHKWSLQSRNFSKETPMFTEGENEPLIAFARDFNKTKEHIDYFIFGHKHILLDYEITTDSHMIFLGDWIHHFSYAVFDGESVKLCSFKG